MKKLFQIVVLALGLMVVLPGLALANTYSWNSTFGGYVDDNCNTPNERFELVLYRDINGGVITYLPLNDQASSVWAKNLPSGYCLIMSTMQMYNGTIFSLDYEGQFANLTNYGLNDVLSAAKRTTSGDSLCSGPA